MRTVQWWEYGWYAAGLADGSTVHVGDAVRWADVDVEACGRVEGICSSGPAAAFDNRTLVVKVTGGDTVRRKSYQCRRA